MYPEQASRQVQVASSAAVLAMLVALTGCSSNELGEESPTSPSPPPSVPAPPPPPPPPPPPANNAPSANAGADLVSLPGQALTLDAAGSTDPDGDTLSYSWAIVAGTGGALAQADQRDASFSAATPGTYLVEVTVRDSGNLTASDIVVIDVQVPRSATAVTLRKLPGTLLEGSAQTVAVYVPQAVGPGGLAVTLQSSDTDVLAVPVTIEIPEGESTAAFHVDGIAPGTADIQALAPGIDPASISYTVEPVALSLVVSTGERGIVAGDNTTVTVRLREPAPVGGIRAELALSDATRATLSAPQVDFAAGATEGTVTLTGVAEGPVRVSASLNGGGAGEPLRLMILPAGVVADRGSADLIDAALTAGTITPEQSVVYGIQAAFGDPALPAQFRGNDVGVPDSHAARLANLRIESLSDSAQQAIGKYLFPPIYNDSWGEGVTPALSKARLVPRAGAADVSCFERIRAMPRSDTLPHWKFIRAGAFKVWYPTVLDHATASFHWYTAQDAEAVAYRVAATINGDFNKLGAVLGTVLRDGDLSCNGGDDAIDVYVTRVLWGASAQVVPYLPGECARPGWMWVAPDSFEDARRTRNVIGHELVHLFQLRYARPDCDDWRHAILDEATASWAFDFLYPGDDYEHRYLTYNNGYFDPDGGEWRASPLETGNPGTYHCNGYCDYLFFQWLSRKFSPNGVRMVMDATASGNAQRAYENGLTGIGGGLEQLWPRFALFMWNDWRANVQAELRPWSPVNDASIRHGVVQPQGMFIDMTLNGQPKRELGETLQGKLAQLRGGELPPMTTNYLHLRFTDDNVSRVKFVHQGKHLKSQRPRFKLQAIEKVDGQWQSAEDWSGEEEKFWCRDKRAERVEELVLVFSNSDAGTEPFQREGPNVVQLYDSDNLMPELTISNAACVPWHGTTAVTVRNGFGGVIRYTANVEYKLMVPPGEDPEEFEQLPIQTFVPASGTATAEVNWVDERGCRQISPLVSGPIGELDGHLTIDFTRRLASSVGISTIQGATHRSECPGNDPIEVPGPIGSTWLSFGLTGATLGDDGRTLQGSFVDTQPASGTTTTSEWNLNARREE